MQVNQEKISATTVKLTISESEDSLKKIKEVVLKRLGQTMKLPGFRTGKAPLGLIEKQADTAALQSEFLDVAVNQLYAAVLDREKLRPVAQPKVSITKFVPFTVVEFTAEVEVLGKINLPDYTKIRLASKKVSVTAKEIEKVIHDLRQRLAIKTDVKRAAKNGDQVVIDFAGSDAKTNEPINGAEGKGYPLVLGSDTFIPGFEANLIGLKVGDDKTFTLTFPKDYGVKALQNRRVIFKVTVTKVQKVEEPKLDNDFAAKAGPFKTIEDLREDIKRQLLEERQTEAEHEFEGELLDNIAASTEVAIPASLIEAEIAHAEQQQRQNLIYRGQTWEDYLADSGQTEETYRASLSPAAELRVKIGLILGEIAAKEKINVSPEEAEQRLQLLKSRYQDAAMQAELAKPEAKRVILSRLLSEKTVARLKSYVSPPNKPSQAAKSKKNLKSN